MVGYVVVAVVVLVLVVGGILAYRKYQKVVEAKVANIKQAATGVVDAVKKV